MKTSLLPLLLALALSAWPSLRAQPTGPQPARPNFLFIAIDDLNDFTGYAAEEPGNYLQTIYPDPKVRAEVRKRLTPNMDRLAATGTPFVRNYCPSPLCGPSRTALMTGVPTHTSGYYMHSKHFRTYDTLKDTVTLPQYLKAKGYFTAGGGKIFHKPQGTTTGKLGDDWADARYSWSQWINGSSGCNGGIKSKYSPTNDGLMAFGPSRLKLEESGDYQTADFTARLLLEGEATNDKGQHPQLPKDRPFFLGAGLFRPHLPFHAPQEFFKKFPVEEMTGLTRPALNAILEEIKDLPKGAERFTDTNRNGKFSKVIAQGNKVGGAEGEVAAWREMVQAYLGCVSFADACVGRILEGLEKSGRDKDTIVVLWSDHGFHVGSKYHVAKQALWEEATRTTFIIRNPFGNQTGNGVLRRQITSLADIYPTLCELAGLPAPKLLTGKSLVSILQDPNAKPVNNALVMTYGAGNHSLRGPAFRFIRYRDGSQELYDMIKDPGQITNLAQKPELAKDLAYLNQQLTERTLGEVLTDSESSDGD